MKRECPPDCPAKHRKLKCGYEVCDTKCGHSKYKELVRYTPTREQSK